MKTFSLIQRVALGLAVLWIFDTARVEAQTLEIGFPYDGAVFQQEPYGAGRIEVLGYFNSQAYQNGEYDGSVSLTALDVHTGTPTGTTSPFFGPLLAQTYGGGFFSCGFRDVPHGWYRLTVVMQPKNPSSGLPARIQSIKVGIGEVFIIGGQSNAEGVPGDGAVGTFTGQLDGLRVQPQAYDSQGGVASNSIIDPTQFFSSRSNTFSNLVSVSDRQDAGIGPSGPTLWLWGRLGQKLVDTQNVPVAFYNAGWGGTTITEWSRSTDMSKRVASFKLPSDPINPFINPGEPYSLLRKTLGLYGSVYGVRAVLWQQGETDTKALNDPNDSWGLVTLTNFDNSPDQYLRRVQSSDEYRDRLRLLIQRTRADFYNNQVAWMIARASFNEGLTSSIVTGGQTGLGLANVFDGPNMDNIIAPNQRRTDDGVHFSFDGLNAAADAWFSQIIGVGLLNATPITVGTDAYNPRTVQSGPRRTEGDSPTPKPIAVEPVADASAHSVSLSADGQYIVAPAGSTYQWMIEKNGISNADTSVSNEQRLLANPDPTGQTRAVGSLGMRRALVQDAKGRYFVTQAIPVPYYLVNDLPKKSPADNLNGASSAGTELAAPARVGSGLATGEDDATTVVYPNPVGDEVTIRFGKNLSAGSKFSLSDMSGRTLPIEPYITQLNKRTIRVAAGHLQVGQYLLQAAGTGLKQSARFMKR